MAEFLAEESRRAGRGEVLDVQWREPGTVARQLAEAYFSGSLGDTAHSWGLAAVLRLAAMLPAADLLAAAAELDPEPEPEPTRNWFADWEATRQPTASDADACGQVGVLRLTADGFVAPLWVDWDRVPRFALWRPTASLSRSAASESR